MKIVFVELDRCIACLSCVQVCLFQQADRNRGWIPNIFLNVDIERRRIHIGTCQQCETALCMEACPVGGITRDPKTAAVVVDKAMCIGCGLCVAACPFGNMHLDESFQKATKCDLCGGNPKCVQVCMAKALHFGSIDSLAELKLGQTDLRLGVRAVPVHKDDD
jgi:carbon-monoxide dehydrogenase iron sulfur subunit